MTIMEAVRDYLKQCPLLEGDILNVDFLPPDANGYSVDSVSVQPVVKRYLDGSTRRQFLFVLATRTYYGEHIRQQIDNLGFFEAFEKWLAQKAKRLELPNLGHGRKAEKLEVASSGYNFAPDTELARYQIQCRLVYFEKGER